MIDLSPIGLLARAVVLLLAFPLHEGAHALVAYRLGDDTPRRAGRLTLNPLKHLDPLGSILFMIFGIGWASTPVSPWRLRYGPRVGGAIVSAAGPAANLLLAIIAAIVWRLVYGHVSPSAGMTMIDQIIFKSLGSLVVFDILLLLFNLIPLAPLDGNSILNGLVGAEMARTLAPLQTYGPTILMGLMLLTWLPSAPNVFQPLISAVVTITRLLAGPQLTYLFFALQ